jgi:hypothetical protein
MTIYTIFLLFVGGLAIYLISFLTGIIKPLKPEVNEYIPQLVSVIISIIIAWMIIYLFIIRLTLGWQMRGSILLPYYMYFFIFAFLDIYSNAIEFESTSGKVKLRLFFFTIDWSNFQFIYSWFRIFYIIVLIGLFFIRAHMGDLTLDSITNFSEGPQSKIVNRSLYGYDINTKNFSEKPLNFHLWNSIYLELNTANYDKIEIFRYHMFFFKERLTSSYDGINVGHYRYKPKDKVFSGGQEFFNYELDTLISCDTNLIIVRSKEGPFELYYNNSYNGINQAELILKFK